MSSTNQSPQYQKAESMFLSAKTDNERLTFLEEMIRECPKHKSSEKMLSQLKIRLKKLKEKIEKSKKKGKSSKVGIKKEEMQAVIIGFSNVGKSSLLSILTKAEPKIEEYKFTTKEPIIGMVDFKGSNIQLIESPSIESNYYNPGVTNTADTLIIVVDSIQQIEKIEENIKKASKKRIIIFNDKNKNDLRKISSTLSTKKYNYLIKNLKDILKNIEEKRIDIEEIKEKIFLCFGKKRVFTKEPGKEKSKKPIILESDSDVYEVAKKILKNIGDLKETKIWGPSSKFPGQKVGLKHILKDLDIIEFKTK